MDFVEVLGRAWHIIWKHKVLWIFGIMAGCARGGGGSGGGGAGGGSGGQSGGQGGSPFGPTTGSEIQQYLTTVGEWIGNHWWVVAVAILFVLVLIAIALFLGMMGRIGLIRGTFKADGGAERLGFVELFQESLPFFWRIFALFLLFGLAVLIIVVPLVVFGFLTFGLGILCILPLICILIPVSIVAGIVIQQAGIAIVIENLGIMDGVRRGWNVVKTNLGSLLIIWLITLVIGFVVGIIIALPVLIVVVPAAIAYAAGGGLVYTPLVIGAVCFAVYLPILLVLSGILTAYLESVWTLTYLRLTQPKEGTEAAAALPANA